MGRGLLGPGGGGVWGAGNTLVPQRRNRPGQWEWMSSLRQECVCARVPVPVCVCLCACAVCVCVPAHVCTRACLCVCACAVCVCVRVLYVCVLRCVHPPGSPPRLRPPHSFTPPTSVSIFCVQSSVPSACCPHLLLSLPRLLPLPPPLGLVRPVPESPALSICLA